MVVRKRDNRQHVTSDTPQGTAPQIADAPRSSAPSFDAQYVGSPHVDLNIFFHSLLTNPYNPLDDSRLGGPLFSMATTTGPTGYGISGSVVSAATSAALVVVNERLIEANEKSRLMRLYLYEENEAFWQRLNEEERLDHLSDANFLIAKDAKAMQQEMVAALAENPVELGQAEMIELYLYTLNSPLVAQAIELQRDFAQYEKAKDIFQTEMYDELEKLGIDDSEQMLTLLDQMVVVADRFIDDYQEDTPDAAPHVSVERDWQVELGLDMYTAFAAQHDAWCRLVEAQETARDIEIKPFEAPIEPPTPIAPEPLASKVEARAEKAEVPAKKMDKAAILAQAKARRRQHQLNASLAVLEPVADALSPAEAAPQSRWAALRDKVLPIADDAAAPCQALSRVFDFAEVAVVLAAKQHQHKQLCLSVEAKAKAALSAQSSQAVTYALAGDQLVRTTTTTVKESVSLTAAQRNLWLNSTADMSSALPTHSTSTPAPAHEVVWPAIKGK